MPTNSARATLKAIIAEQGVGVLTQPRRVESLLSDLCPDQKRETNLLAGAQREGVPDDLRASSTVPPPLMRARLQQRLADNLAVTEDAARWAVETWAIALGLLAESEAVSGTSLRDSQRPHPTIAPPTPEEPTPFVTPQWQTPTQEQTPPRQETPQWQTPLPPVQGGVEWQTQTPPTPVQGGAQWQGTAQNQEPQWQTQPQGQAVPQNNAAWPPPVAGQAGWQMGMNDSGTGAAAVLPPQLRGFNWGALWLSWIWAIGNSTWIGLLALIPCVNLVMMVVLGVKGNEWAWQNRRWNSIEEFQAQQKVWAIVGWVLFGLSAIYYIIVIIVAATSNTHTQ